MSNLYTFTGGVRIRENMCERMAAKEPSSLLIPNEVEINIPEGARTSLKIGDRVLMGQKICSDGSAFSSVSGEVIEIKY